MPDKTSVLIAVRIARDGEVQELAAAGELHRLTTGWAVTCRLPESAEEGGQSGGMSEMMLIVREGEVRMTRKGAVAQEQLFRVGEWRQGTVGTAYGAMPVEAWTHAVRADLGYGGGTVEWAYDMRMDEQVIGRSSITLTIREERRT